MTSVTSRDVKIKKSYMQVFCITKVNKKCPRWVFFTIKPLFKSQKDFCRFRPSSVRKFDLPTFYRKKTAEFRRVSQKVENCSYSKFIPIISTDSLSFRSFLPNSKRRNRVKVMTYWNSKFRQKSC